MHTVSGLALFICTNQDALTCPCMWLAYTSIRGCRHKHFVLPGSVGRNEDNANQGCILCCVNWVWAVASDFWLMKTALVSKYHMANMGIDSVSASMLRNNRRKQSTNIVVSYEYIVSCR